MALFTDMGMVCMFIVALIMWLDTFSVLCHVDPQKNEFHYV